MALFDRSVFKTLYITVLLSSFNVYATDDAYMKQLEVEAKDVHLDESGQRKNTSAVYNAPLSKEWVGECDFETDLVQSGLTWEEFPSYLKQCSLAIYVYYRRLDINLQHSVYDNYSKISLMKQTTLKKEILTYF